MNVVDTLNSQDVLAKTLHVSSEYVSQQLKKAFADDMKPYVTKDRFGYMRKKDHELWLQQQAL